MRESQLDAYDEGAVERGYIDEGKQAAEDATHDREICQRISEYTEGVRCAAAWLAKNDEALVASIGLCDYAADDWAGFGSIDADSLTIYVYGERQRERVAELIAAVGGKWDKDVSGTQLQLSQIIAGSFRVRLWIDRDQVCVAKVVGTEEVEVTDYEAVGELPKKKITRDVIEWECAPLLSGAEQSTEGKGNNGN